MGQSRVKSGRYRFALICGTDPLRIHRFRYLLCAEGVSYFVLSLLEFLTHTIPILHQDLSAFKLADIILGISVASRYLSFHADFLCVPILGSHRSVRNRSATLFHPLVFLHCSTRTASRNTTSHSKTSEIRLDQLHPTCHYPQCDWSVCRGFIS